MNPNIIITFDKRTIISSTFVLYRIVREGEFMANPKYVRKRIDFNLFDDIGHGHKIHATSFNMNPEFERQPSISVGSYDSSDLDSTTGSGMSLARRSSFTKGSNYLSLGRGGKASDGRVISNKRATASPMRFPTVPSTFPRAPSAFPMVPESSTLSSISGASSDGSQNRGLSQQVDNIDNMVVFQNDFLNKYKIFPVNVILSQNIFEFLRAQSTSNR